MLCFGSTEGRFLRAIYRRLEPLLHLLSTTVRVSFVYPGEEVGLVKERKLCLIITVDEDQALFVSVGEILPRWYLSYAKVGGVWLFKPGHCEDPVLIIQTFARREIQKAAVELVEAFYRKREESLRNIAEVIDSLRGSFEEGVEQDGSELSVLIA